MNPNQPAANVAVNPGKGLGIASLVFSLLGVGPVGLILGIIGKSKSKNASQPNGLALAGIIIGILDIVFFIGFIIIVAYNGVTIAQKCSELGTGTHVVNNVTYTCGNTNSSSVSN